MTVPKLYLADQDTQLSIQEEVKSVKSQLNAIKSQLDIVSRPAYPLSIASDYNLKGQLVFSALVDLRGAGFINSAYVVCTDASTPFQVKIEVDGTLIYHGASNVSGGVLALGIVNPSLLGVVYNQNSLNLPRFGALGTNKRYGYAMRIEGYPYVAASNISSVSVIDVPVQFKTSLKVLVAPYAATGSTYDLSYSVMGGLY